jgi:hypothetical protein
MDLAKWKSISGKFGKLRTGELRRVDAAVESFRQSPSQTKLEALARSILAWQALGGNKTNWLADSIRGPAMRELVNLVKEESEILWPQVGGLVFNHLYSRDALAALKTDPLHWLNRNSLTIAGGNDGIGEFFLQVEHGDPTYSSDQIPKGHTVMAIQPRWRIDEKERRGAKFNAMCIGMHTDIGPNSTAANVTAKLVALPANCDLVVTGMMNGCTFVIRDGGQLACTHIMPVGQEGEELQDQIIDFNLPNSRNFGQNDYGGTQAAAVVGVGTGGWKLYAQLTPRMGQTINRVEMIYP